MATASGRVQDMTQGNPLKLMLAFAIPMLIGNIFQQLYNMADTMVVGHILGDTSIAAIGATTSLYTLLINFSNGLNNGYSIVVTQRFGARNIRDLKQSIAGMMVLNSGITAVITALALCFLRPLMVFLNIPADIFDLAYSYISVICWGVITTIAYNMFANILRSLGNSRTPLYFLMFSSGLNVALDLVFVSLFRMGVAGAAVATVIAQAVSAVLCGLYVFRHYRAYLPQRQDFRVSLAMYRNLFSTGMAVAMMSCLVECGSIIFTRANNLLGRTAITAYTSGRRIMSLCTSFLGNLAHSASIFVGQNWGARKIDRIRKGMKTILLLEVGWSLVATTLIYLFGASLVRFVTGTEDPQIISMAVLSLRIHFAAIMPLGVLFALRNCLQAMGYKSAPLFSSIIELAFKILSASLLIPRLGFIGTCITEPICWCLMAAFLAVYFFARRKALFHR